MFFHHIVDHPRYAEVIGTTWSASSIQGNKQFKLARALKLLKPTLRNLNRTHYSGITNRVKEQAAKVEELQRILLTQPVQAVAIEERQARLKWNTLKVAEEKFYRQKSRVQWLHLGDKNTAFFHKTLIYRTAKNHIHFLRDQSGRKLVAPLDLKNHVNAYFQSILGYSSSPQSACPVFQLQNLLPFRCSEQQSAELQRPVSEEEVRGTLFALPLNKCPGPDGYSVEFFRASWSVVGSDVVEAVQEFFRTGKLLKDFNNTTIALIPKTTEACSLKDYRPIS